MVEARPILDLGKWQTVSITRPWGWTTVHVMPLDDLRDHVIRIGPRGAGHSCWCAPAHDRADDLVVHNALDGREKHERGAKMH